MNPLGLPFTDHFGVEQDFSGLRIDSQCPQTHFGQNIYGGQAFVFLKSLCSFFGGGGVSMAVVIQTNPFFVAAEECPRPGNFAFHKAFLSRDQCFGKFPSKAWPDASGPRHEAGLRFG